MGREGGPPSLGVLGTLRPTSIHESRGRRYVLLWKMQRFGPRGGAPLLRGSQQVTIVSRKILEGQMAQGQLLTLLVLWPWATAFTSLSLLSSQ